MWEVGGAGRPANFTLYSVQGVAVKYAHITSISLCRFNSSSYNKKSADSPTNDMS